MALLPGTRVQIVNDGEGWFPEYQARALTGTIHESVRARGRSTPWYVVQFDETLELQERGGDTPSGLHLVRYTHALIANRLAGDALENGDPISCYLCLVREGAAPPRTEQELSQFSIQAWPKCSLLEGAA
jgi:hypothetical protein